MINNEELRKATEELKELVDKYNNQERKFSYDKLDFRQIELNPGLNFVCNGDKKEIEVLRDE
jgi:hypothetical protein